jgi:hypothetical protein
MESKRPAEEDTDDASVKVARAGSYSDAADVTEVSTTGEEGRRASSKWDIVPEETEAGGGDAAAAGVVPPTNALEPLHTLQPLQTLQTLQTLQPLDTPIDASSAKLATIEALLSANPELVNGPTLPSGQLPDLEGVDLSIKMSCHTDVVFALLSHEGTTLKTIRETAKCHIRLLPPTPTDPHIRYVLLAGSSDEVCGAIGLVLAEIHKSCQDSPAVCTPDKIQGELMMCYVMRMLVPSIACGSIIGKGGSVILGIRQKSSATVKIEDALTPESNERPLVVTGPIERVHVALLDIVPIVASFNAQMKAKGMTAGGGMPGGGIGAATKPGGGGQHTPGYNHPVPALLAGKIIGPGGSSIRQIREATGARVKVNDEVNQVTQERMMTIWGDEAQVQQVLQMVNEIIARPDTGRPPRPPRDVSAEHQKGQQVQQQPVMGGMGYNYGYPGGAPGAYDPAAAAAMMGYPQAPWGQPQGAPFNPAAYGMPYGYPPQASYNPYDPNAAAAAAAAFAAAGFDPSQYAAQQAPPPPAGGPAPGAM